MSQTQSPAYRNSQGENIDYTPAAQVYAGDVVVVGNVVGVATQDIAANALGSLAVKGLFRVPKKTGAIAAGDPVYWDASGNPVTGTAGTGAASNSGPVFMGYASAAAASGDDYVYVNLGSQLGLASVQSVAAAGSTAGDAAAVTVKSSINFVHATAADGTKGIILPANMPTGAMYAIENSDAANAILKVYPPTGSAINALSANAAISMAAKASAWFVVGNSTQIYTVPKVPS